MINPAANSGKASALSPAISDAVRSFGLTAEISVPATRAEGADLLRQWVDQRCERVIVVGGDGMMHLAVNQLAGSSTALGLIHGGTGNDSATGLGIPKATAAAVAAALGPAAPIDLIHSGNHYACSVATAGFSVAVNVRADAMSYPKGGAKYTIASLVEIPRLATHDLTLTIDDIVLDVSANLLAIANTPMFGGGMQIAPDADPTDGLLDIVVIGPASRSAFVRLLPTVFFGRHIRDRRVAVHRGAKVRIEGPELEVRADGEPFGQLPIELTVAPAAIQIAGLGPEEPGSPSTKTPRRHR